MASTATGELGPRRSLIDLYVVRGCYRATVRRWHLAHAVKGSAIQIMDGAGKPSGRWRLRVYVGRTADGKVLHRSRNVRGNKASAEAALRRFMAEVGRGSARPGATVGLLVKEWWELAERRRAQSTLIGYRRKLDHDILPAFGRLPLDKLTPALLDRQYRQWESEGLAPATVRQLHAILSAAFAQGVKWGWLEANPTKRATPPSVYRTRRSAITVPELQALIRQAERSDGSGGVVATAVALGALTGARRGELCALRWSDWDGGEQLRIARALTVLKGGDWVEGPTKTHQERTVTLDVVASAVLARRRNLQDMLAAAEHVEPDADPFTLSRSFDGAEPCRPDGLSHNFGDLVEQLWPRQVGEDGKPVGDPRWHFHDLRHFVATISLAGGASARTVADRLGHADPSMTLRVYAHAVDQASRDLAELLGAAVSPTS